MKRSTERTEAVERSAPATARVRLRDERGVAWTTSALEAGEAFHRAVDGFARHRASVPALLEQALAHDPEIVGAHVLRGLGLLLLGRRELVPGAREAHRLAAASVARRGATDREVGLVEALAAWCEGEPEEAAERLAGVLRGEPLDLFTLKAHHAVTFYLGRSKAMRAALELALPAWRRTEARGLDVVLGCLAFARTETDDAVTGEALAAEAAELAHARGDVDPWGKHARVHALDALSRSGDALEQATQMEADLAGASNFAGHVRWHEAMLRIERGELDRALALHDDLIALDPSRDYRDLLNCATLLYRVEKAGVDVGTRWRRLVEISLARMGDHGSALADVHHVLVLVAAGSGEVDALLAAMERVSNEQNDHAARLVREVGLDAARAVRVAERDPGEAVALLQRLAPLLPRLGGSRAQRRIFTWVERDAARRIARARGDVA